ncbi:O-methyltransferase [Kamptonema cortianum]|nr:O-methyltransferase [Geitlerinema splendidum]MDK3158382.1 O-methyltransferase [Kamptonema cortianum]
MNQFSWDELAALDQRIEELFKNPDPALENALENSHKHGLPNIHVSYNQGKLLTLLTKLIRPKRILEIGTLGGYSTICLARGLAAGGSVLTLEASEHHAKVARENIDASGLGEQVVIRIGPALDTLPIIEARGEGPFDLVFIDADKEPYPQYFDWALKLTKSGSVIIADNVGRRELWDDDGTPQEIAAIRQHNRNLAACDQVDAILLPLLREHVDGMSIAIKK